MTERPYLFLHLAPYVAITIFVVAMIVRDLVRKLRGEPRRQPRRWPTLTFIGLMVLILAHGSLISPSRDRPDRPKPRQFATTPAAGFLVFGVPVAAVLGLLAWQVGRQLVRHYDRDVAHAWKRRNQGDRDGAIADLRAAIAAKGPSAKRWNGLGVLLMDAGDWDEARRVFEQAFAIDPQLSRGNLAITLLNMDDPTGAEALYRPIIEARKPEPGPMELANYAHFLARLNRLDEAESYLDRADALLAPGSKRYYLGGFKAQLQSQIAEGRAKLAELRGTKKVGIDPFPEL